MGVERRMRLYSAPGRKAVIAGLDPAIQRLLPRVSPRNLGCRVESGSDS